MATTAMALSDRQLEEEVNLQRRELDKLQERLRGETRTLDAAKSEHGRVVVAIENGSTGKEHELARAKESVETSEIRVGGVRKQLALVEAAIEELNKELYRRQLAANIAARQKEFTDLQTESFARARALVNKLVELTKDLAELDKLRIRLGSYVELGGFGAADRVAEVLFRNSGPNEKLRDPNTHNRLLEDQGWVFAGSPGETYEKIPSAASQFGNPLRLTVQSMRPGK
jgi:hypothetical protein